MMGEWKEYKLGDVCSRLSSGKNIRAEFVKDSGLYPVYGGNGLRGYTDNFNFEGECGIIGRQGAYCGNVRFFKGKGYMTEHAVVVQGNEFADTYYLSSLLSTMHLERLSGQSAQPGLAVGTLSVQNIVLPDISIQKKISSILSTLDAKIENNNKINANLEAQAQALFKSWFVDFEPFQDGEFEDSELGRIPKGWKVGTLADLGEIVGGSTPSKAKPEYYTDNGIAWLTPKDLSISGAKFTSHGEIDITEAGYNSTSTKLMPRGSVLFSSRAPIGYITIAKNDICTNQGFKSVVPTVGGTCYIYCLLKYLTPEVERKSTGSTFKEASGSLMKSLPVIIPPKDILSNFENIIKPSFDSQEIIEDENKSLSTLRDTLLPKLMSGEIEV